MEITITSKTPVIKVDGRRTGRTPEERRALADTIDGLLMAQMAAQSRLSENVQQEQTPTLSPNEQTHPAES